MNNIKNKTLFAVLIVTIVAQIITPLLFISEKYNTLNSGKQYKVRVTLYDPYDAYRGRYLALTPDVYREDAEVDLFGGKRYGVISTDKDGYAYISDLSINKPEGDVDYVISSERSYFEMPVNRYYTNEELAPNIEKMLSDLSGDMRWNDDGEYIKKDLPEVYVVICVRKGESVIKGLYIDEIPIEEYYLINYKA